ncbi:hypothetical protein [Rhodococcus sp. 11-3]|uniref:hypothetical protein n=1 Tax=Rhodococcus sp. 11-3 TaxID=2854796 RepID=UPI00203F00ED|nr:hypothetical protein [Rhodococcus sp. 11-3]USC17018.1 hypothetical protein KZJ41_09195 [Rhodococcus sp. 11-3]
MTAMFGIRRRNPAPEPFDPDWQAIREYAELHNWYSAKMVPVNMPHFHDPIRGLVKITHHKVERFEYVSTGMGDSLTLTEEFPFLPDTLERVKAILRQ